MSAGITRVAVLGGGPAGVAAAFELTATEELRARHQVTVYQPGWRLGGKCASGRNAQHHQRIEEHGLHVFFGFYDNAFDLVQRAYDELKRPAGSPLATWQEAFQQCSDLVFFDEYEGRWNQQRIQFPTNDRTPGSGDSDRVHFDDVVQGAMGWLLSGLEQLTGVERADVVTALDDHHRGLVGDVVHDIVSRIERWLEGVGHAAEHEVHREVVRIIATELHRLEVAADHLLAHMLASVAAALRTARDLLWKLWVDHHLGEDEVRFVFTSLDLFGTMVSGIVADDLMGDGFQKVNGEELSAWLRRHGARDFSVQHSPILRGLYDLTFAYRAGDPTAPDLAAGQALEALIRIGCLYKGSVVYKMMAGMGDTIFGPMYEVLLARGVEFKMFHWVSHLGLDPHDDVVDTIEVIRQVDTDATYPYLVDVVGLPCWPSEPAWDHITGGPGLRDAGVDLEQTANPLSRPPITLQRGVDFDEVVLAVSTGGLGPITTELVARNDRFAAMLQNSATVGTRAVQVWTTPTTEELGWPITSSSIATSFVEPLDTYCDMSHLIGRESFPAGAVGSIAYFCGPMVDGVDHVHDLAAVHDGALDMLGHDSGPLWPKATRAGGFEWNALVADDDSRGPSRFDQQYWRANTQGTERYVLTPAGSVEYRLRSDESGFSNLVLAGDWTRNGIDGGAVEAAFASGRMASRALCGSPAYVPGEHGPLVDDGHRAGPPDYVEFGGLDTFPGPYLCNETTLYTFMVEADLGALERLVSRVLTRPTMGAMEFRPLAPMVMLTVGDIAHVVPQTPPYNTYGSVNEAQVAVWVPVAQVRGSGTALKAVDFWMFTSYIWVDNPMSMATGREMYGWPKSMGVIHLPDDKDPTVGLQSYSLNFAPGNQPSFMPLLELVPTASKTVNRGGTTVGAFARSVVDAMKVEHGMDLRAGLGLGVDLSDDAVDMALPEIYLKQLRSIECGTNAALQQVCQSDATIQKVTFEQLPSDYALTIHGIDSHPLATDLGIADQVVKVAFRVEMDFLQDVGQVIWDAFDPSVVPPN